MISRKMRIQGSIGPKCYFKAYIFRYFRSHLIGILLFLPRSFDEIGNFFPATDCRNYNFFHKHEKCEFLPKLAIFSRSFVDFSPGSITEIRKLIRDRLPKSAIFSEIVCRNSRLYSSTVYWNSRFFSCDRSKKITILFRYHFTKFRINFCPCSTKFAIFYSHNWRNFMFFFCD